METKAKAKTRKVISQAEIQELRELISETDNDRVIELFNKFHSIFNHLAVFYKEKKNEENRTFFYWQQYDKMCAEKRNWETEKKRLKEKMKNKEIMLSKKLDTEIQNNVELYQRYKELQIENEKLKK